MCKQESRHCKCLLPYLYEVRYLFWRAKTFAAFEVSWQKVNWKWILSSCGRSWIILRLCYCSFNLPTRRRQTCSHSSCGSWTRWSCVVMRNRSLAMLLFFTSILWFHHMLNAELISEVILIEISYCLSITLLPGNLVWAIAWSQPHLRQCMICCCTVSVDCVVPALGWILNKAKSSLWRQFVSGLCSNMGMWISLALHACVVSV